MKVNMQVFSALSQLLIIVITIIESTHCLRSMFRLLGCQRGTVMAKVWICSGRKLGLSSVEIETRFTPRLQPPHLAGTCCHVTVTSLSLPSTPAKWPPLPAPPSRYCFSSGLQSAQIVWQRYYCLCGKTNWKALFSRRSFGGSYRISVDTNFSKRKGGRWEIMLMQVSVLPGVAADS